MVCGKHGPAYTNTLCDDCGWNKRFERLLARKRLLFTTAWAKDLYETYHQDSRALYSENSWYRALLRDAPFFQALESHFSGVEDLSGVLIVRRVGCETVLKHRRAISYLSHKGIILTASDPDYLFEMKLPRIRALVPDEAGWENDVLRRFLQQMLDRRSKRQRNRRNRAPTKASSFISALQAARKFVQDAKNNHDVTSVQGLSQNVLDHHMATLEAQNYRLLPFARYLNSYEKLFRKLRIKSRRLRFPFERIMPEHERELAMQMLWSASDPASAKRALVLLLSLVYGQHTYQACAIRRDAVREGAEGLEIKFNKVWIPLDPETNRLMAYWLSVRRELSKFEETDESIYLFPGRLATAHMQALSVVYKSKWGVRELRATGIASLVKSGVNMPRVLTDAFGISRDSATVYCEHLSGHLGARARIVVGNYD